MINVSPDFLNTYYELFNDSTVFNRLAEENPGGSALGAWVNLVIIGKALEENFTSAEKTSLEKKLGVTVNEGFEIIQTLADQSPKIVKFALAFWTDAPTDYFYKKILEIVGNISVGEAGVGMPDQEEVNQWVSEKTLGLISSIDLEYPMDSLLINALATKISWKSNHFNLVDASAENSWGVEKLLHETTTTVRVFNVDGVRFAVHDKAGFIDGETQKVVVHSIIGPKELPLSELSKLFTLVSNDKENKYTETLDSWFAEGIGTDYLTVTEKEGYGSPASKFNVTLPSWSSFGNIGNEELQETGFGDLSGALFRADKDVITGQVIMAKYTATGYEAAAVTFSMMRAAGMPSKVKYYEGELTFNHPYLAVATFGKGHREEASSWESVPLFLHVVNKADESTKEETK